MQTILVAIGLQIIKRFIAYEFICKILVVVLEKWAESTKTDLDDKIFEAMAKALGVDSKTLQDLVKAAEGPTNG